MIVRIKKLNKNAVTPSYANPGDGGMDLTCTEIELDTNGNYVYKTGLAMEIPKGFVGLLFPRSSNCKKDLMLTNSVGILDSGYRGEIMFKYKPNYQYFVKKDDAIPGNLYELGDRVGQLIILPYPEVDWEEVNELSDSIRGWGGYGSTGN
jgi:dUTP pyrophosphatase